MKRYLTMSVVCFCFTILLHPVSYADSFEDKLKNAITDYLEKEVEKHTGSTSSDAPEKVHLKFSGAEAPTSEVLTPLSEPERPIVTARPAGTTSGAEQQCYDLIQGKIPWNSAGNKNWSPGNVRALCAGTTRATEPGVCFNYVMFRGSDWGQKSTHKIQWGDASTLCQGTSNSASTTACFKAKINANQSVSQAAKACAKNKTTTVVRNQNAVKPIIVPQKLPLATQVKVLQEKECYDYVQGKIAWDNAGKNKNWSPTNVKRLCKGTTSKYSPGNCFNYVMFKGSTWGKRPADKVDWSKAIDLCEGISNNKKVTTCFKSAIASGKALAQAIKQCEKK